MQATQATYAQEIPHRLYLSQQESFRSFLFKLDGLSDQVQDCASVMG